jgi:DNA mismatch repair protein MutS
VERSRDDLDRQRDEQAVEAKGSAGESVQAVFDVGSGEFVGADGRGAGGDDEEEDGDSDGLDPEAEAVLAELSDVDVAETTPVELLSRVQEWQSRLDGE